MPTFIPNPAYGATRIRTNSHSRTRGFVFSLLFAALIAVSAQVAFPVPFTDVPITLQVLAVLLAGGVLGARWGTLSVLEYIAAGLAGAPVFAQGKAGLPIFLGTTGGYLIGFALAAFCVGWITDRSRSKAATGAALLIGIFLIWASGSVWRHYVVGLPWAMVLQTSVLPFVAADLLKAVVAWVLIARTPRLSERR